MRYICLFIFCLMLFACEQGELSATRYAQWVNANLKQRISTEKFDFTLAYQPVDYQVLRTLGGQIPNQKAFDEALENHTGHHYMNLKVHAKDAKKIAVDNELRFHAQADFKAIVDGDTIPCVLYHLNEINQDIQFAFVFKDDVIREELTSLALHCKNKQLCPRPVQIDIPSRYIKKCPNLAL